MTVLLTKVAAQHVKKMLAKRGKGIGLRLGVKKYGCNGFGYVVDYADAVEDNEQVFTQHEIQIIISNQHLPLLTGIEINYIRENALNEGFEFHNPNAVNSCGCGESFNIK